MRTLLLALAVMACRDKAPQPATVTVEQVDQALGRGQVQPVDANGESTRKHEGVLPGAILLSDSETWQLSELPPDKTRPLVFYCANEDCSASDHAARRAITAGYQHVEVMSDGIAGWVKAGKKTQAL